MNKITPCLWFDTQAEEAANFYVSLFKSGKIHEVTRYEKQGAQVSGQPEGSVMTVRFELDGQDFLALNGGPLFQFTPAISLIIDCETQEEVDHFWDGLLAKGGQPSQCGWLQDRFGVSWQVTPKILPQLFAEKDPKKTERVMAAMLKMQKLDIAALKKAAAG